MPCRYAVCDVKLTCCLSLLRDAVALTTFAQSSSNITRCALAFSVPSVADPLRAQITMLAVSLPNASAAKLWASNCCAPSQVNGGSLRARPRNANFTSMPAEVVEGLLAAPGLLMPRGSRDDDPPTRDSSGRLCANVQAAPFLHLFSSQYTHVRVGRRGVALRSIAPHACSCGSGRVCCSGAALSHR